MSLLMHVRITVTPIIAAVSRLPVVWLEILLFTMAATACTMYAIYSNLLSTAVSITVNFTA
jgi:hypothetical protein